MYREKVWYLKNVLPLFMGLQEPDYQTLDCMLTHMKCKAHAPIYLPGEGSDYVYLLKEGRVRLSQISAEGKEVTLDYLEPGAVFGALGVGEDEMVQAEAVENAYLCKVPRADFERFIAERPQLMFQVTKLLGLRLRRVQVRLHTLLFHDVRTRLLKTLEELAETYGEPTDQGVRLRLKLTHQDLANLIGSTRETTSAIISQLRTEGVLDFDHKHAILKQTAALGAS